MVNENVNRRGYVKYAGAGIVVIAVAGAGAYYATKPGPTETPTTQEKIDIGIAIWGFADEGTWDGRANEAMKILQGKGYSVVPHWFEETTMTDIEDILRMAAKEYSVVWAHSSSYEEAIRMVAPDFPDTYFVSEYAPTVASDYFSQNTVNINQIPNEGHFAMGALTAKMTKTNKIGIIQAISGPLDTIYSTSFRDGIHYINPDIEVNRIVVEAYVDPIKTRDSIISFEEWGADTIFVQQDDYSGMLEC